MTKCAKCGKSIGWQFTYNGVDEDNNPVHYCRDCKDGIEGISNDFPVESKTIQLIKLDCSIWFGFKFALGVFLFILLLWLVLMILSLVFTGSLFYFIGQAFS
jgi:hypothetical protein